MKGNVIPVVLLAALVDFLLLQGTAGLSDGQPNTARILLAALLGGVFGGISMRGDVMFLEHSGWRMGVLILMGWIAFGVRGSGFRQTVLFALLSLALGGLAVGLGQGSIGKVICSAVIVIWLLLAGFRGNKVPQELVEVHLESGDAKSRFYALRDTGNTLRDPVTGESVMVVEASVASRMFGLTQEDLEHPVETLARQTAAGFRLIPYRSVGQSRGMLLAMRIPRARIGTKTGPALVAFAPSGLDAEGSFQALIGGNV